MLSLGQKINTPLTCQKLFYKNIRVVLRKKTARKNTKYSRNDTNLKDGHLAKATAFAKCSVLVKNKNCQVHAKNYSTRTLELFFAKKPLKKTPNIREMRQF